VWYWDGMLVVGIVGWGRGEEAKYLSVSDDAVLLQPGGDQRAVFLSPVGVELLFGEGRVAVCEDGDADEVLCGHGCFTYTISYKFCPKDC
jgi:hypothetical protein